MARTVVSAARPSPCDAYLHGTPGPCCCSTSPGRNLPTCDNLAHRPRRPRQDDPGRCHVVAVGARSARTPTSPTGSWTHGLEREKGITIPPSQTAVRHGGVTINIIDTPATPTSAARWNAGSSMVDGVCCWSTRRGPLPQTRFVLRKALAKTIAGGSVVNKVDRPDARIAEVVDEVYELFFDLDATRGPGSTSRSSTRAPGRPGASLEPARQNASMPDSPDLEPLFETLVSTVPAPSYDEDALCRRTSRTWTRLPTWAAWRCRIHAGTIRGPEGGVVPRRRHPDQRQGQRTVHDRRRPRRKPVDRPGPATSSRWPAFRRSRSARPWRIRTTPSAAADHGGRPAASR